jgi:hypothetical protein
LYHTTVFLYRLERKLVVNSENRDSVFSVSRTYGNKTTHNNEQKIQDCLLCDNGYSDIDIHLPCLSVCQYHVRFARQGLEHFILAVGLNGNKKACKLQAFL